MHSPHMSHKGGPSYIGVATRSADVTTDMNRQRAPNSGVIASPHQPISASPAAVAACICDRSGANRLGIPGNSRYRHMFDDATAIALCPCAFNARTIRYATRSSSEFWSIHPPGLRS